MPVATLLILGAVAWAAGAALFGLPGHTIFGSSVALAAVAVHPAFRAPGVPRLIRLLLGGALLLVAVTIAVHVHNWQPLPDASQPGFQRALLDEITDPARQRANVLHSVSVAAALTLACLSAGAAIAHLPRERLRFVPHASTNALLAGTAAAATFLILVTWGAWLAATSDIDAAELMADRDENVFAVTAVAVDAGGPDYVTAAAVAGVLLAAAVLTLACCRLAVRPD